MLHLRECQTRLAFLFNGPPRASFLLHDAWATEALQRPSLAKAIGHLALFAVAMSWSESPKNMRRPEGLTVSDSLSKLISTEDLQLAMLRGGSSMLRSFDLQRSRSSRAGSHPVCLRLEPPCTPDTASRSRLPVAAPQNLLAQFGLSRTEVEQWLHENGQPQPTMSPAPAARNPTNQYGSESSSPCTAGSSSTLGFGQACGDAELAAIDALSGSSASLSGSQQVVRKRYVAQQKLQTFEEQVHYVARQAAALHQQQQVLRDEEHMDRHKLDSLLGVLNRAAIGVSDSSQQAQPTARPQAAATHPSLVLAPVTQPVVPNAQQRLRPLLPSESLVASGSGHRHEQHHHAPSAMRITRSEQEAQPPPRGQQRHSRRRNHRQDQLSILRNWFDEHKDDPYPTPEEKIWLASQVGMQVRQIEHCAPLLTSDRTRAFETNRLLEPRNEAIFVVCDDLPLWLLLAQGLPIVVSVTGISQTKQVVAASSTTTWKRADASQYTLLSTQ